MNASKLSEPVAVAAETSTCPVCQHVSFVPVIVKNGYAHVRCLRCQAIFVQPMPSPEQLNAHYQNPAYFQGETDQGYRNYADMHRALRPHFLRRLKRLERELGRPGRLLDYGCADGYFLQLARTEGWDIAGLELSATMREQASQALAVPIAASLDGLREDVFDAITLWEVIEHLPQPAATLERLRSHLRPKGVLMLSTPNAGHWQVQREPDQWRGFRPPSHLVLFEAHALNLALARAGFARIEMMGTGPLPALPAGWRRVSAPLEMALATGQAKPWFVALMLWRVLRVLGWGWQRVAGPREDIFATLEGLAQSA